MPIWADNNMSEKIFRNNREKTIITVIIFISLITIVFSIFLAARIGRTSLNIRARSEFDNSIPASTLSFTSDDQGTAVKFAAVSSNNIDPIYVSKSEGTNGVFELISDQSLSNLSSPKQRSALLGISEDQFVLRKKENDETGMDHYKYEQVLMGIPVVHSYLGFHQRENEVISAFGNYSTDTNIPMQIVSQDRVKEIVYQKLSEEVDIERDNVDYQLRQVIFNPSVLGQDQPGEKINHLASEVTVRSEVSPALHRQYIVNIGNTGKFESILFEQNLMMDAKSREIHNCKSSNCPVVRSDSGSSAASGDNEIDQSWEILGEVYDFFKNKFNRDSYDNRGSKLIAYVHFPGNKELRCPNAAWYGKEMVACSGVIANDIWAHEFGHGVTGYSAGLAYANQSGALNESMSDIWGWALDQEDWKIGEDLKIPSIPNPLRYMDDPPRRGDPDRIFGSDYYCGSNQNALVHKNSGVLNKGFYLMVEGGSFNQCNIRGIGADKALQIIYQALTKPGYLGTYANFREAYTGIVQACFDLSSGGSGITQNDCEQTRAALQAVEMDQQPASSNRSPVCTSGASARKTPSCVNNSVTNAPTQITPTNGLPTAILTQGPTGGANTNSPTPVNSPLPTESQLITPTSAITPSVENSITPEPQLTQNPFPSPTTDSDQEENPVSTYIENFSFSDLCITDLNTEEKSPLLPYRKIEFTCLNSDQKQQIADGQCRVGFDYLMQAQKLCQPEGSPPVSNTFEGKLALLSGKFKFQGASNPAAGSRMQLICTAVSENSKQELKGEAIPLRDGSWYAYLTSGNNVNAWGRSGEGFKILCKGPVHLQRRFCDPDPVETEPGQYRCDSRNINLKEFNYFDFSSVTMMVGDMPPQDGLVNGNDIARIRNNLGSTDPEAVAQCDLDFDGACTTRDHALLIEALQIRYEEN